MISTETDLKEEYRKICDTLKERGWKMEIHPYFDDGDGEMLVTTNTGDWENFNGEEEILSFFRTLKLFFASQ